MPDDFILYLFLRKDMDSLNHAGKMIAQGAHAANHAATAIAAGQFGAKVMQQFSQWEKQTSQGFGTTIVFGRVFDRPLTIQDIRLLVEEATRFGFAAGVTHDPTYPLLDGKTLHTFPCDTCGWIFGSKAELAFLLQKFDLHPEGIHGF